MWINLKSMLKVKRIDTTTLTFTSAGGGRGRDGREGRTGSVEVGAYASVKNNSQLAQELKHCVHLGDEVASE